MSDLLNRKLTGWSGLQPQGFLKKTMGFIFRSEIIFRTTRVRIFIFFVGQSPIFFSHNLTLGYMTKILNHIIFFSSTKIRIFVQQHWESEYFFRKKP